MARFLLGVSGGVAAYRALELARLATRAGHGVRVLMTPAAKRFVGPASFEAITGAPVLSDEFERDPMRGGFPGEPAPEHDPIGHLEVAANADAYLIAPASANTIAKLAAGIADSMLTTAFLACAAPRAVAPAMNNRMYEDAATQANLATLRERGILVVDPEEGALASRGEHGVGRLAQPERLLAALESMAPAPAGPWDGLRVLITAGGTREPIDSVRYIGNRSSGRMGLALAAAARARGADVTMVAANVSLPAAPGVRVVAVETAAELAAATAAEFATADVLLMAAAVADFTPAEPAEGKLVREGDGLDLRLEPTADVLARLAAERRPGQTLIGFAAEHGEGAIDRARQKLARKGVDAVVFNDVSRADIGFDSEANEVVIVEPGGEHELPRASKDEIAAAILDRVAGLRADAMGPEPGQPRTRSGGPGRNSPRNAPS
ncbi:MAG: phosphopantothenoylcysteine decarboxylase / phosphopantothenate---cysteine ligase [Solirubrobacterales bacterium]|nr:phosphopantothenoylcysteine decarboxylase / phosphopantothenate---cysteine ligase [Solirubrobacterales bacterium]